MLAWAREITGEGLDAILVTTSGCGTAIKDYGHLFRGDRDQKIAAMVAAHTLDISEYLVKLGAMPSGEFGRGLRIAYHAACSLQHGQRVRSAPRELLQSVGFDVVEVPEGHLCCGSAGVYNLLQPGFAGDLRARKIANIAKTGAALVAAGNIGCLQQLEGGLAQPIVHTIELLDWASGGPLPIPLKSISVTG
jgi:glycolate oxidase iron-sulfur subunit